MKTLFNYIFIFLLGFALLSISCQKEDINKAKKTNVPLSEKTFKNLYASDDRYTKFDFTKGDTTISETDWDIAFSSTTIIINGGTATAKEKTKIKRTGQAEAVVVTGIFKDIKMVPANAVFQKDGVNDNPAITTGSGNGWYSYNMSSHVISPIPGKVLIFKTRNGKFVKVEILSYYKNAPVNVPAMDLNYRYYTFRYFYQPDGSKKLE